MKRYRPNGRVLTLMLALALFNFLFLGTEYQFDNMMMALVTEPKRVVAAQGYVMGSSALGCLLFPVVATYITYIEEKIKWLFVLTGALAGVTCIFVIWQHGSYGAILAAGFLYFILTGMAGSAVNYYLFREAPGEHLAKTAGVSYATGIFFQFLNDNLVKNDMAEAIVLAAATVMFSVLLLNTEYGVIETNQAPVEKMTEDCCRKAGFWLVLLAVGMSCIFSALDTAVTLTHAEGGADVGQWPRLLLGASSVLAGVLFDSLEQRYGNILMYCVTVLSVLCIVVLENGGPFLAVLVMFYLSAGFFVVFFTVSFMRLSPRMKYPKLWPGLGRAVNHICAFFTGFLSVRLIRTEDQMLRDSLLLIVLVLINIVFFVYSNALYRREREENGSRETQPGEKESMEMFAAAFSLTEREKEVLEVLLVSDENVQNIAETLMISRAALYRHIASINEKTGTRSRIGLIQFYYQYHRRNEG